MVSRGVEFCPPMTRGSKHINPIASLLLKCVWPTHFRSTCDLKLQMNLERDLSDVFRYTSMRQEVALRGDHFTTRLLLGLKLN